MYLTQAAYVLYFRVQIRKIQIVRHVVNHWLIVLVTMVTLILSCQCFMLDTFVTQYQFYKSSAR